VGDQIASGSGSLPLDQVVCDGAHHRYTVRVVASTDGPPFQPGEAVGQADVDICTHAGCASDSWGPRVITLVST
jgi:hypothetical protein